MFEKALFQSKPKFLKDDEKIPDSIEIGKAHYYLYCTDTNMKKSARNKLSCNMAHMKVLSKLYITPNNYEIWALYVRD